MTGKNTMHGIQNCNIPKIKEGYDAHQCCYVDDLDILIQHRSWDSGIISEGSVAESLEGRRQKNNYRSTIQFKVKYSSED